MGYGGYLKELLEPLGVYDLSRASPAADSSPPLRSGRSGR